MPVSIASLENLRIYPDINTEFIYVDSASTDNSVQIAREFFDQVFVLEQSSYLCAASGRFVGTVNAKKEWVLYLDGDMELCPEFIDHLKGILNSDMTCRGYVGQYEHVYPNGSINSDGYGRRNNYVINGEIIVKHFGGAVLLPRNLVLQAGNYHPCVFSNEEIDLHTRIRANGGKIVFVSAKMIRHHTDHFSKITTLLGFYWPTAFLGKKFYGFGQLMASRFHSGDLASLVKYYPYPFIFWGCVFLAGFTWFLGQSMFSILTFLAMTLYIGVAKGARFLLLYPGLMTHLFWVEEIDPFFRPVINQRYFKREG